MQSGLQRPTGSTSRPLAQELGHRQGLNARSRSLALHCLSTFQFSFDRLF